MSEFVLKPEELVMNGANTEQYFKNVKEFKTADGKVRIKDGALIVSDETGTDRVLIGYYKDLF